MGRLEGKVAIVTGGAQGMGESHVRHFIAEGASVAIADINVAAGEALAADVGPGAFFAWLDVTSSEGWQKVAGETEKRFGPVSVLVNNAGIVGPVTTCEDLSEVEFQRICGINQTGAFLGMKHVIPSMKRAGGGSIINIASISGIVAIYGTPNVAYAASKFAMRGLTKQAAMEFGADNIRVNSVHPGGIDTGMLGSIMDRYVELGAVPSREVAMQGIVANHPIGRMGRPDEMGGGVVYLCSEAASFVTCTEFLMDGGFSQV